MSVRSLLSRLGLALLALAGADPLLAAGKCERLIASGNPDQPPYLWRDPQHPQQLIGASADLLKELGQALGLKIALVDAGKRSAAEADAASGRVDLLAGTYLTAERLERFDFVHPAYLDLPVHVWVARDKARQYASLADLASHSGLAVGSAAFPPALAEPLAMLKPARTRHAEDALRQLQQGKVDYLLLERQAGQGLVERLALHGLQALEPPLGSAPLYLAISHNSACNDPWLRGQLAKKMTEFVAAGLPQTLLQRNLQRWKQQPRQPSTP